MDTVLTVSGLGVEYETDRTWLPAVTDVSFEVKQGEILGIVGESGCGKSTLARALVRLLPDNGRISSGSVELDGYDLVTASPEQLASLRWARVAVVFQSALNSLDPVYTVGFQIAEAIRRHESGMSRSKAFARAEELLESVGIARNRVRSYPHELSGGMRQRVSIAMAMALSPDLVVADEPTTALDVVSQDGVLHQLVSLQREKGASLILISHDMGVIAETCDRVAVMYAGKIVELAPVEELFRAPAHPYSMGLRNAIPTLSGDAQAVAIPGFPPPSSEWGVGCRFAPRCPFFVDVCSQPPPWTELSRIHHALCHRTEEREQFRVEAANPLTWVAPRQGTR
jgi:peptide/nickel transport system ATP-binding protein